MLSKKKCGNTWQALCSLFILGGTLSDTHDIVTAHDGQQPKSPLHVPTAQSYAILPVNDHLLDAYKQSQMIGNIPARHWKPSVVWAMGTLSSAAAWKLGLLSRPTGAALTTFAGLGLAATAIFTAQARTIGDFYAAQKKKGKIYEGIDSLLLTHIFKNEFEELCQSEYGRTFAGLGIEERNAARNAFYAKNIEQSVFRCKLQADGEGEPEVKIQNKILDLSQDVALCSISHWQSLVCTLASRMPMITRPMMHLLGNSCCYITPHNNIRYLQIMRLKLLGGPAGSHGLTGEDSRNTKKDVLRQIWVITEGVTRGKGNAPWGVPLAIYETDLKKQESRRFSNIFEVNSSLDGHIEFFAEPEPVSRTFQEPVAKQLDAQMPKIDQFVSSTNDSESEVVSSRSEAMKQQLLEQQQHDRYNQAHTAWKEKKKQALKDAELRFKKAHDDWQKRKAEFQSASSKQASSQAFSNNVREWLHNGNTPLFVTALIPSMYSPSWGQAAAYPLSRLYNRFFNKSAITSDDIMFGVLDDVPAK